MIPVFLQSLALGDPLAAAPGEAEVSAVPGEGFGDCMMVLFKAPVPVKDHEYMAVKTALEMKTRLRKMLPELIVKGIPEFQVGIGINTGMVFVHEVVEGRRLSAPS